MLLLDFIGHGHTMMQLGNFTAVSASASTSADISTFTNFATQLLSWLVTTFGTVLNFMLANPICFVGLVMVLIVGAIGTLRHLIGG